MRSLTAVPDVSPRTAAHFRSGDKAVKALLAFRSRAADVKQQRRGFPGTADRETAAGWSPKESVEHTHPPTEGATGPPVAPTSKGPSLGYLSLSNNNHILHLYTSPLVISIIISRGLEFS